jgi:ferric-dicitrate binding protein FerR (iron transport regulator)
LRQILSSAVFRERGKRGSRRHDTANRYNQFPQIRVEGAAAQPQLMGIFDADDPQSLVLFLKDAEDLVVERRDDAFVVHDRRAAAR